MTSSPNFGSVAETYARVRPGYPPAVFDDLLALTGLADGASVLEIGAATGPGPLEASGLFIPVDDRRYLWQQTYSTDIYKKLLSTYSDHIALPEDTRIALLDCVASLIDRRYDGNVTKQYLTELVIARKR